MPMYDLLVSFISKSALAINMCEPEIVKFDESIAQHPVVQCWPSLHLNCAPSRETCTTGKVNSATVRTAALVVQADAHIIINHVTAHGSGQQCIIHML